MSVSGTQGESMRCRVSCAELSALLGCVSDKLSGSTLSCITFPSCSRAEKRLKRVPPSGLASTSSPVAFASSPVASAKKRILPADFVFSSHAEHTAHTRMDGWMDGWTVSSAAFNRTA